MQVPSELSLPELNERFGDFLGCYHRKSREPARPAPVSDHSYLFLLPSLIFFLGFVIYPMILCVVTSFFDSAMNCADVFV